MDKNLAILLETIEKMGISVTEISNTLDIPANRIYQWKTNRGNPKAEDSQKIQKWLEQQHSATHAAYHNHRFKLKMGAMPTPIPVYAGNTTAGQVEVYSDDPAMQQPVASLPATLFPSCNHAEKVTGNSMYPRIVNQGYVVGKKIDKTGPITPGEIYGVHYNGQAVVKYLHHKADGIVCLKSDNKEVPDFDVPLADITFLFRVYFILNPA